jgi:hypothetical protein
MGASGVVFLNSFSMNRKFSKAALVTGGLAMVAGVAWRLSLPSDRTALVGPPYFAPWQASKFPGGGSYPESGLEYDPDKVGLADLIEYAQGTGSMISNPSPLIHGRPIFKGQPYFTLTVSRNPGATDTVVAAEAGSGLVSGEWSSNGLIIENNTATELRVRDSQPMQAAAPRFFRVQVQRLGGFWCGKAVPAGWGQTHFDPVGAVSYPPRRRDLTGLAYDQFRDGLGLPFGRRDCWI